MPKLYQLLETKNRKEQEERVENLIAIAQTEISVITIVVRGGMANFGVIGRPDPQVLIQALDVVRDDILMAVAKQKIQQEKTSGPPQGLRTGEDPTLLIDIEDVTEIEDLGVLEDLGSDGNPNA